VQLRREAFPSRTARRHLKRDGPRRDDHLDTNMSGAFLILCRTIRRWGVTAVRLEDGT
jgi:hypothetical protein